MEKTYYTMVNKASLAGSASTTLADCTALTLTRAISTFFEVEATFNSSATAGLSISWYASYDNSNYDTSALRTDSVAVSAGNSVRVPLDSIDPNPMYLKATVENLDSTYAVTNLKIIATLTEV